MKMEALIRYDLLEKDYISHIPAKVFRENSVVTPCPFNEIPEEHLDGKIGEKQDEEKQQFMENFFKEMKEKFVAQK